MKHFPIRASLFIEPFCPLPSHITVPLTRAREFVQFDLTALPVGITAGNIAKATLALFAGKVESPGSIGIARAGGIWTGIHAHRKHVAGRFRGRRRRRARTCRLPICDVDVTSAVGAWLSSTLPNHGFVIVAALGSGVSAAFDSNEIATTSPAATLTMLHIDVAKVARGSYRCPLPWRGSECAGRCGADLHHRAPDLAGTALSCSDTVDTVPVTAEQETRSRSGCREVLFKTATQFRASNDDSLDLSVEFQLAAAFSALSIFHERNKLARTKPMNK